MLLSLVSCKDETSDGEATTEATTVDTTKGLPEGTLALVADGKTDYSIVYSDTYGDYAVLTAELIQEELLEATGVEIPVKKDSEAVDASEYEIVIGRTAREGKEISFDREGQNWTNEKIHIGIYENRLFMTAKTDIALYEDISFIMERMAIYYKDGELLINEKRVQTLSEAVPADAISVISQNLKGKDGSGNNAFELRWPRLMNEFTYYSPDVIGFCENGVSLKAMLDEQLEGYATFVDERWPADEETWRNLIYYRTDRLEIVDSGVIWLSHTPEEARTKIPGAVHYRTANWAVFEIKTTGTQFVYMATHFDAYGGTNVRAAEAAVCIKYLEKYFADYPVILSGDLNGGPNSTELLHLKTKFDDAKDVAVYGLTGDIGAGNGFSIVEPEYERSSDFILASKGDMQKVIIHRILNDERFGEFVVGGFTSDHYGVYSRILLT